MSCCLYNMCRVSRQQHVSHVWSLFVVNERWNRPVSFWYDRGMKERWYRHLFLSDMKWQRREMNEICLYLIWQRSVSVWYDRDLSLSDMTELWWREMTLSMTSSPLLRSLCLASHRETERERARESGRERERARESERERDLSRWHLSLFRDGSVSHQRWMTEICLYLIWQRSVSIWYGRGMKERWHRHLCLSDMRWQRREMKNRSVSIWYDRAMQERWNSNLSLSHMRWQRCLFHPSFTAKQRWTTEIFFSSHFHSE